MGDIQTLVDMGFAKEKAEYAMKVTNNKGVEPAMEWLLAHADEDIPVETAPSVSVEDSGTVGENTDPSSSADVEAKSLKCDDCGKLCKDQTEVEFHAAKTGHSNFSESMEEKKPLTEEEKKAQLALIEEKLKQKRREREEREKGEALEREKNRIKSGKDMTEARKRMEELEMKKIVDQRKREKAEEKAARERVRAQIEADKAARKAREQNQIEQPSSVTTSPTLPVAASTNSVRQANKDYTQTRLQVRLRDGSTLTETFNVKEPLSAVRVFIQLKTGDEAPFNLMTTFPRKVFTGEDFEKPLDVLGLVPSAVLIMTK
ncbi:UBX domain-containing protein 1-B-like [Rhagoletis pomonella]|uniref:UBX domain-containing protein 1-B-like n=1 Tax=Rhagoletis pomonella TaxID=28610 RepID=UPI00177FC690|nr:UBX domain-containing protein 1-B-like [Rhagoletis pomonella]XP_036335740.1 UBX domain-containing protein 1-B-like [Rhagoletis pomonella]XP_036335741.1 UBX domain-containing protein 1-B-like [Rhagoletis pomonella]